MEFIEPSWDEIIVMVKQLAEKVDEYKPDILIGISRGGLVPVRLLSDYLHNENVAVIKIEFYHAPGETSEDPTVTQPLTMDVKGKKVLLVDDVSDSGRSLIIAKEYVKHHNPGELKVAALHYKPQSKLKPDYYIGETDAWIIYPWEVQETRRKTGGKSESK